MWTPYAMLFKRYDPRVSYFDSVIMRMTDSGVKDYLFRRALPFRDMKDAAPPIMEEKMYLELFILVFAIASVGIASGIVAFAVEFMRGGRAYHT